MQEESKRRKNRLVFSANELGRITVSKYEIERLTDGAIASTLPESFPVRDLYQLYQKYPELDFLPIQGNDGEIQGYITRQMLLASLSKSYFSREILLKKDVTVVSVMDPRVTVLDAHKTLFEASHILMQRDESIRYDPFVITLGEEYYGTSTLKKVLDGINFYMKRDLDACLQAQQKLFLQAKTPHPCATLVEPLHGPGGDLVQTYTLNQDISLFILFDVCGKGIRAAQMVTAIGSLFYSEFTAFARKQNISLTTLGNKIMELNNLVFNITQEEMYATGLISVCDNKSRTMAIYDFGHGFTWLKRKNRVHHLPTPEQDSDITFFGIKQDLNLRPQVFRIKSGDILFACSDGIVEARNSEKEEFGIRRIVDSLVMADSDPDVCNQSVLSTWKSFRKEYPVPDDYCLLSVLIP